jgi:putative transposase
MAAVASWEPRIGRLRACRAFGINERTWRHHHQNERGDARHRHSRATHGPPKPHPAQLTQPEKDAVVEVLCSPRFCDVGVAEAWATLLDEGTYLCSIRTMHRILAERDLTGERRQQPGRDRAAKPRVVATAPNQVYVWDISRLKGPGKGFWFYLYAIWDLWSRKIVGWTIDTTETADIAHHLIDVTCGREGVDRFQLIIHSDRGAQMMSVTLTELYDQLGVRRSLSRPRVSNDNPQAEAGFKTLKYRATGLAASPPSTTPLPTLNHSWIGTTMNITTPGSAWSPQPIVTPAEAKQSTSPAKPPLTPPMTSTRNGSVTAGPHHRTSPTGSGSTHQPSPANRNQQNRQPAIDTHRPKG